MRLSEPFGLLFGTGSAIAISAALFIAFADKPVFDDIFNLPDVLRYAREGVSLRTIEPHINPAGPLAYVWMGALGTLLGGELWSFRLVNLLSLLALGGVLTWFGRKISAVAAAACAMLVNPYLPLASASLLTEVPSLLALMLGVLLWHSGLSSSSAPGWAMSTRLIGGGTLIGLAITGRQYYLAALPAMAIVAGTMLLTHSRYALRPVTVAALAASLVVAVVPVLVLFWLWGGLTPRGMQTNLSEGGFSAKIGFGAVRPLTALLLIGIYTIPLLWLQSGKLVDRGALFICSALALVVVAAVPQDALWCIPGVQNVCGPVGGLEVYASSKAAALGLLYNVAASLVGFYGVFLLGQALLQSKFSAADSMSVFAATFLLMFVIEQFFVGGNIPFYERYMLQVAPFIGLCVASRSNFSVVRALAGSLPLLVLGQHRLWKLI